MKTLFLNPPSYEGFDGGAGARYQATREIRSFWYPTWLAQPAAMIEGSKLVDAPARGLSLDDVLPMADDHDLIVMHTSTPSYASDARVAAALKARNPRATVGFVGAHVAILPDKSLELAPAVDFVARHEFDYTIKEIAEGAPYESVDGVSFRRDGKVVHNRDRALIHNMDELPYVTDVYARDLVIEDYFIGYLKHPYVSLYTGRGCKSRCTFCLWPQTIAGHTYRTRSPEHVADEIRRAKKLMPQVQEFFFDDDTFTDNAPRAEAIARLIGKEGITWSCNAKANVPYETLKVLRDNGLRLLLVGYEFGQPADPAQHQEGHADRGGAQVHRGLPQAGHHHPRHVHRGAARRDAGDHRRDHQVRARHQPIHHPGLDRRALSRHVPLRPGDGERLAGRRRRPRDGGQ